MTSARALIGVNVEIWHVGIVDFRQLAVRHRNNAFVEDEEILKVLRFAVTRENAVWGEAYRSSACVFDTLSNREHKVLINRDRAGELQAVAVVPGQGHGRVDAQIATALCAPNRVGAGHLFKGQTCAGCPSIKRIIRAFLANR